MRLVGDLVAVHADVAHAGGGDQVEHAIDHAEAGAQDGHDRDLLAGDLPARGGLQGRGHFDVLQGKVTRGLVALEQRQLADELAELLG